MLSPQRHPIAAELEVSDCYIQSHLSLFAGAPLYHYTHHAVAYLAVAPLCRRHHADRSLPNSVQSLHFSVHSSPEVVSQSVGPTADPKLRRDIQPISPHKPDNCAILSASSKLTFTPLSASLARVHNASGRPSPQPTP